ncbi:FCD domain-containing protein [Methylobacterium organophilum]|nr:FCD domain-containing protein [Methylobacterium organophilum]
MHLDDRVTNLHPPLSARPVQRHSAVLVEHPARLAHDDQQHYQARLGREHEQIYEAIARQDPESARAAMRLHLTNSRERLRQAHEEAEASTVG